MQFPVTSSQFSVLRRKTDNRQPTTDSSRRWRLGFSMIELLVVISIITILIAAGVASYTKSQQKVRDGKRKGDLKTMQVALDQYYSKNGSFPKIYFVGGNFKMQCYPSLVILEWGNPFTCNSITYLNELPKDPLQDSSGNNRYLYSAPGANLTSNTPQAYTLYAKIENTADPDINTASCSPAPPIAGYNYCVTPL